MSLSGEKRTVRKYLRKVDGNVASYGGLVFILASFTAWNDFF